MTRTTRKRPPHLALALAAGIAAGIGAGCNSDGDSGSDGGGSCDEVDCGDGCCRAGECYEGNSVAACGANDSICDTCLPGESCRDGECSFAPDICTLNTCSGCCLDGECVSGDAMDACGRQGQPCMPCKIDEQCEDGHCVVVGGERCGGIPCAGCCLAGECVAGASVKACGVDGAPCAECQVPGECVEGECTGGVVPCGPTNCPGCCDVEGACLAGTFPDACGGGGKICIECVIGEGCINSQCTVAATCGPSNCNGCCRSNDCLNGTTDQACGTNGESCDVCSASERCRFGNCNPE